MRLDATKRPEQVEFLEEYMRRKVVGQQDAVDEIVRVYQMQLAGVQTTGRPLGNLLFLGPTGVGKTKTVEALAERLYGNSRAMVKINCAEFQHSHEMAKLIGSPPGYLGHRETHAVLTQENLNKSFTEKDQISIVLFDEIEKASDSLWALLLGILDKAELTLGDNRMVNFSRSIIVMTSNIGARDMANMADGSSLGFSPSKPVVSTEKLETVALNAAREKFSPEFMNRIDRLVVFRSLSTNDLEKILELELEYVRRRCAEFMGLKFTESAKKFLLEEGTDPKYGARPLKRAIEKYLVMPLANIKASGQLGKLIGKSIYVHLEDRSLVFDTAKSAVAAV